MLFLLFFFKRKAKTKVKNYIFFSVENRQQLNKGIKGKGIFYSSILDNEDNLCDKPPKKTKKRLNLSHRTHKSQNLGPRQFMLDTQTHKFKSLDDNTQI